MPKRRFIDILTVGAGRVSTLTVPARIAYGDEELCNHSIRLMIDHHFVAQNPGGDKPFPYLVPVKAQSTYVQMYCITLNLTSRKV
jgi:hypothetical protein